MRAVQIAELTGPDALRIAEVDEPDPDGGHPLTPGEGVVIDVRAAGVSFPDVLQTRGLYQYKPDPPFVPGAEVAGTVRSAPEGSGFSPGDRVAGFTLLGGMAEVAVAPAFMTFRLPDALDWAAGAALLLNYHTAHFSLVRRGRLRAGERVLVHGASGGVGTASIQVARAVGAEVVAVVSSEAKEAIARDAGAQHVLRVDAEGGWLAGAKELGGIDVVLDPVGGDRFTDSLRSLREEGRLVVVGFTGGDIPQVKVNRLLLRNTEVIGAGWGAYVMPRPDVARETGEALEAMIAEGHVRPVVGARYGLDDAPEAFRLIDERGATGKIVLDVAAG